MASRSESWRVEVKTWVPRASDLALSTQNGPLHVALAGSRWDGAGLDAEAENGPLNLVLPADYSARFETGALNGPGGMNYPIESNHRRGWITTTLGKGGPPVRVVTHNGPFQITER